MVVIAATKTFRSKSNSSKRINAAVMVANAKANSRSRAQEKKKNDKLNTSLLKVKAVDHNRMPSIKKWTAEDLLQCNVYADGGVGDNEPIQPTNEDGKEVKVISIKKKSYMYRQSMPRRGVTKVFGITRMELHNSFFPQETNL